MTDPLPQPDHEEAPAGLFGAAPTSPHLFQPSPVVTVGGTDIPGGPTGPLTGRTVVDGLSVSWGRDDVLTQPEPPTGHLQLFDATGTWATDADRRGLPVSIRWEGTDPAGGAPLSAVFFRGRIGSPIKVSRKTVVDPETGREVRGALVDLPLVSTLVDLANRVPSADWPEETVAQRRARLAAEAADVLPGGVISRPYWDTPNVAPVAAADQVSVLEHLVSLFDSTGADRYTYWPWDQSMRNVVRRDYPTARGLSRLWWNITSESHPRAGLGAYIRSAGMIPVGGTLYTGRQYLDAGALEYDPADGLTQTDRITRAEVNHPDAGDAYRKRTELELVAGLDETQIGVRTARVDSVLVWNPWAELAASDLAELGSMEGGAWRLEPLVWSTRKTGGFDNVDQAMILLRGGETDDYVFFQRSWLPSFGQRPVFGVMGGVIGYADGGWELELNLSPLVTRSPQHRISWEELDTGNSSLQIRLYDTPNTAGFHPTLTLDDLEFVTWGLVQGTISADTTWDVMQ